MLSVCSVLQLLLCEECPASLAVLSCTCAMKETAFFPAEGKGHSTGTGLGQSPSWWCLFPQQLLGS